MPRDRSLPAALMREIRARRLLPLIGAWFAGLWLAVELLDFAGGRYGLDERWVDVAFALTWLLLPGMLLVFWRVGPPGDAEWRRRDGPLLVLNLVLALVASAAIWWLRAPGPVADIGTPAAETSPARAALSSVLMLPLQPQTDSADSTGATPSALALAVPELAAFDLMFDERVLLRTLGSGQLAGASALLDKIEATRLDRVPLSAQRRLAEAFACSGIVQARYQPRDDGRLDLELAYVGLAPARELARERFEAVDPWEAADRIADGVRRHFARGEPVDGEHDPAVRAVSSDSLDAILAYAQGVIELNFRQRPESAQTYLARAVADDPQFSLALAAYAQAAPATQEPQAARAALARAVLRSASLPEPMRFALQAQAFQVDGQFERAREIFRLWSERRPHDATPRRWLLEDRLRQNPHDAAALAELEALLATQPWDVALRLALARRLHRMDRFEQALGVLEGAGEGAAEDFASELAIAEVLGSMGRIEDALLRYRKAEALQPDATQPALGQAQLLFAQGRHAQAMAALDAASIKAGSDIERAAVLGYRILLLRELGGAADMPALLAEHERLLRVAVTPQQLLRMHHLTMFDAYADHYGVEAALRWAETALLALPAAMQGFHRATLSARAGRHTSDAVLLQQGLQALPPGGPQGSTLWRSQLEARLAGLGPDPDAALQRYREVITQQARDWVAGLSTQRVYTGLLAEAVDAALRAGQAQAAADWAAILASAAPGYPRAALAVGRWHLADGRPGQAADWAARARRALAGAQPGHELRRELEQLLQALAAARQTVPET